MHLFSGYNLAGCRFLRGLAIPVLASFEIGDAQFLGINASSLGAIVLGAITFCIDEKASKSYVQFTDEVIDELNKVTWPEKDETVHRLWLLIGLTLFIAAALGIYDYVWAEVTQIVLFSQS